MDHAPAFTEWEVSSGTIKAKCAAAEVIQGLVLAVCHQALQFLLKLLSLALTLHWGDTGSQHPQQQRAQLWLCHAASLAGEVQAIALCWELVGAPHFNARFRHSDLGVQRRVNGNHALHERCSAIVQLQNSRARFSSVGKSAAIILVGDDCLVPWLQMSRVILTARPGRGICLHRRAAHTRKY